ncbi:ABC transporter ATP-binding protein [Paenarthrobacter ilicis]|uniref:ABC-2 type transport system ATP-binding protein n=1 Tax=Paenarthrobacter ilicis TaxID=43665 RepID=A0ABX0TF19_9MICC|nr:ABC transporter ATP-binding protein [Paenarthrobacter ilicis]MBM7792760.1 ABC-2 type transport system ATP-binding protein [Paenarthrobacter ilicis]NIJ01103.1 ABC-2 type transport system ATP-binding protein [Paenarthrobacter ilicis]
MPQSASAIEAVGLHVTRARSPILRGLDFTVESGEITGLLGPSGSGKTTLMRAIVGVQRITSGTVKVFGQLAGSTALRHDVGYVTQGASVYGDLSVEANVRYFGAMHGATTADVTEAIDAVGLQAFAKRKATDLSGGQFSRVSLACALVSHPRLLVLDEPTVGLDPVLRAELWDRFAAMARSGTTLLVSSHVMEEASHCSSLLLLRNGQLMAHLTPAELAERGRSRDLERAFLNIITAEATAAPGQNPTPTGVAS